MRSELNIVTGAGYYGEGLWLTCYIMQKRILAMAFRDRRPQATIALYQLTKVLCHHFRPSCASRMESNRTPYYVL